MALAIPWAAAASLGAWARALLWLALAWAWPLVVAAQPRWYYIDAQGARYVATEQVHAGYIPVFGAMPAPQPIGPGGGGARIEARLAQAAASVRSNAALEITPGYRAIKPHVRHVAQVFQLEPALLQAIITHESGFEVNAVSERGARGLMQIMPNTAMHYGLRADQRGTVQQKLHDPRTNLITGARHLRHLLDAYPGQTDLAIAAYNAGETAVRRAGRRIPNYPQTRHYVRSVMGLYGRLLAQDMGAQLAANVAPSSTNSMVVGAPWLRTARADSGPNVFLD